MFEDAQNAYERWALEHADGRVLTVIPPNPKDEWQEISVGMISSRPNLEKSIQFGIAGMGQEAFDKLGKEIREKEVLETIVTRHKKAKNVLIPTLHLRSNFGTFDTAITHNRFFSASDGDPEFAAINDILVNPMMSRLQIIGVRVFKVLTSSGVIDLVLPLQGAKDHGMADETRRYIAKRSRGAFEERLKDGVAFHWSLQGTRGKAVLTENGSKARYINRVANEACDFAIEHLSLAIPIPLDIKIGDCKVEVLEPRELTNRGDIHEMYEEMAETAANLTGEKIYYGKPEGAVEIEEESEES